MSQKMVKKPAVSGDAQSPVTARLRDITSRHGIRHKCDI